MCQKVILGNSMFLHIFEHRCVINHYYHQFEYMGTLIILILSVYGRCAIVEISAQKVWNDHLENSIAEQTIYYREEKTMHIMHII